MTNLIWTEPVVTNEIYPRNVQVLHLQIDATEHHVAVAIKDPHGGGTELWHASDTGELVRGSEGRRASYKLCNASKSELRMGWVNLYSNGWLSIGYMSEASALAAIGEYTHASHIECRRITWMSDGSPVDQEHHDSLEWGELQAESENLLKTNIRLLGENSRMRDVVNAAVEWARSSFARPLLEAVRVYQEKTND